MGGPWPVREYQSTVMRDVRQVWPTLTEQDVQAMAAWRWSARGQLGAQRKIVPARRRYSGSTCSSLDISNKGGMR